MRRFLVPRGRKGNMVLCSISSRAMAICGYIVTTACRELSCVNMSVEMR